MEERIPKLFLMWKEYSKEQFIKDIVAGIIVAIIALPLSIALALASGVSPEQGIYTAIVAGFVIAMLGGSRVQISGPTAAFATIVAGIVAQKGMAGLVAATILAGVILILMGVFKLGGLIKFIPYTIVTIKRVHRHDWDNQCAGVERWTDCTGNPDCLAEDQRKNPTVSDCCHCNNCACERAGYGGQYNRKSV